MSARPKCGEISVRTGEGVIRQSQHIEEGIVAANFYYLDDELITDERFSEIFNDWAAHERSQGAPEG